MNKDDNKTSIYTLDHSRFQTILDEVKNKNLNTDDMLNSSMKNVIKQDDTNYYVPQNFVMIPTVFPQTPHLLKQDLYEKFDLNTLMFIFFYQNDSHMKYNAGKELTKRGWMYSKRYTTWFILTSPPKQKTDEFIEGKFKYWDFEKDWTTAYKKDFKFELKHLEKFE